MSTAPRIEWPDGKRAAFTVFDDTDRTTLENGPPVYDELTELGLFITKSVWPSAPTQRQRVGGTTCGDADYLNWVLQLQAAGHEIGFHNATDHPSMRPETTAALDRFESLFGGPPKVGADHSGNVEALYWGPKRLSGFRSAAYAGAQRLVRPNRPVFSGDDPDSDYFWGDLCRDRITYWRNFCFDESNLLNVSPKMPYHDPRRPFVNYWFTSTDGYNAARFVRQTSAERLDQVKREGGVCIMYTHFGAGFAPSGQLLPQVAQSFRRIAERDFWVAPVSEVLDHMRQQMGDAALTDAQRRRMENRWVKDRIAEGSFFRKRIRKLGRSGNRTVH